MTNGDGLVCGCMLGWRHSQVKSIGLKFGGRTEIQDLLQSFIWTLVDELEVHTCQSTSSCDPASIGGCAMPAPVVKRAWA